MPGAGGKSRDGVVEREDAPCREAHEDGHDDSGDSAERAPRVVRQAPCRQQRGRAAGYPAQDPADDGREPGSREGDAADDRGKRPAQNDERLRRGHGIASEHDDADEQDDRPRERRHEPPGRRRGRRHSLLHAQRRYGEAAHPEERRRGADHLDGSQQKHRLSDRRHHCVGPPRGPVEGDQRDGRPRHEEQGHAGRRADRGVEQRFHDREPGDLCRRRADQTERGQALFQRFVNRQRAGHQPRGASCR